MLLTLNYRTFNCKHQNVNCLLNKINWNKHRINKNLSHTYIHEQDIKKTKLSHSEVFVVITK